MYSFFSESSANRGLCTALSGNSAALLLIAGAQGVHAQNMPGLGNVSFETTCTQEADAAFEKGLTLLHHMMYFQADDTFTTAAERAPDCAMLHWGVAMSKFHPLWAGKPSDTAIEEGREAIEMMLSAKPGSDLESAYSSAVQAFYSSPDAAYPDRKAAWAKGQKAVYDQFGNNVDAAAFYALSLLATASASDKSLKNQREAGALLEDLNKNHNLHPGVFHYAIHAYDNPALYERGLPFAEVYGEISPDVPHALHMPSHIFVRAGRWDDVIAWNIRSRDAALAEPLGDMVSSHYAHAMDYLIYAQLQHGDFETAEALLQDFTGTMNQQENFGSAYALAASPARVLLEQGAWEKAASLSEDMHPAINWEKFPQAVAMLWFAKGIGAARSGDLQTAEDALEELARLRSDLEAGKQTYWLQLLDGQIMSIEAWLELERGNPDLAIDLQTKAADIEDAVGKSPVTPGHVVPARELLGDMYAQLGQAENAARAYEASLAVTPNRRRSAAGQNRL